ncbi:hypothetical protein [Mucisphaera calidilacus]|uniref:Uncharacterized protein n=1 Tax=Mucisphaera calidilacus TaxID=2527982 RepID=A0A518BTY3_9BACT|nr:hypothetical protein [Mucisphaera calidilacus]QDU70442.1 hypothetical protein Pan265_02690 [Mucisphaera calidilacus]
MIAAADPSDTVGLPLECRHISNGAIVDVVGGHMPDANSLTFTLDGFTVQVLQYGDGNGGTLWAVNANGDITPDMRWTGEGWMGTFNVKDLPTETVVIGTPGFYTPGERNTDESITDALLAFLIGMGLWGFSYASWSKRSLHV